LIFLSIFLVFSILGAALSWNEAAHESEHVTTAHKNNVYTVTQIKQVKCPQASALTFIQLWNIKPVSNDYMYKYRCASDPSITSNVNTLYTSWQKVDVNESSKLGTNYLQYHNLNCPESAVLSGFTLESKNVKKTTLLIFSSDTYYIRYKFYCTVASLKNCKRDQRTPESKMWPNHNIRGLTNQIVQVKNGEVLTSINFRNPSSRSSYYDYSYGKCELKSSSEVSQLKADPNIDINSMERHPDHRRRRKF